MKPLFLHPRATLQIEQIIYWYEEQREGLGELFLRLLDETFDYIERQPEAFEIKKKNLRQGLMRRFPYVVIYEITNDSLAVYGVIHARQKYSSRFRK